MVSFISGLEALCQDLEDIMCIEITYQSATLEYFSPSIKNPLNCLSWKLYSVLYLQPLKYMPTYVVA